MGVLGYSESKAGLSNEANISLYGRGGMEHLSGEKAPVPEGEQLGHTQNIFSLVS